MNVMLVSDTEENDFEFTGVPERTFNAVAHNGFFTSPTYSPQTIPLPWILSRIAKSDTDLLSGWRWRHAASPAPAFSCSAVAG